MVRSFYISTLGCPKNEVDSAKLAGRLCDSGYEETASASEADLVVVNTCAFIEAAREESIEEILELSSARRAGARLAVTGCLAERAGEELAAALPEIDVVAGFGMDLLSGEDVTGNVRLLPRSEIPSFDLLELRRPRSGTPWAYVKVAEGCDRRCGFCAIPSFRGRQRSRSVRSILAEVEALDVKEVVLVAQDLASFGRDRRREAPKAEWDSEGASDDIVSLLSAVTRLVERVRLLYLYPSSLTDRLIDAVVATGVPYFDLSLQHASGRLLRKMRRFGSAGRFLERIERIRRLAPGAALRSSFILGYPGESEADHDELLGFLEQAQLDWAGFFTFSPEKGTPAAVAGDQVPRALALERLAECSELQEEITARRRRELVGTLTRVLVDEPGVARSFREAPEIDGVLAVPPWLAKGELFDVRITDALGPDLVAEPIGEVPARVHGAG
ncbi:MAG: 30S ribosomal protein S12 methylthiotransferase RimO, partial [Acidimicrobiales bacterium]